ncbi:MAG TPA: sugar phosphate isomerase/epimerase family protein [Chloroflexota bacterium]
MKLGIHAMAWTPHWSDESLPLIDRVADLGLDFIEIPLMGIDDVHPGPIRDRVREIGIEVVTSSVLSEATDITSPDSAVRARGVDYLRRCVDATAEMGAPQFSGVIYAWHGKRPSERPGQREWEWAAECLREVARHASEARIVLGLEPVNRYESPLINTCEQAVQLADMISAPNVKIHLDTYHMNIEEKSWREPVLLAGDRLCHFHLCENDRGIPGTGLVDWDELFGALGDLRYEGYAGLESFIDVSGDMVAGTCVWRDLAPSGDVLVRDGTAFLRDAARRHGLSVSVDAGSSLGTRD